MSRLFILLVLFPTLIYAQKTITIDGDFADWSDVPVAVTDPADDVHDTDGYPTGLQPAYVEYTDVDILEVKFTNDEANLYGYIKATGAIGRTSSDTLGHTKLGRYYFIFTIDVDDDTTTGYQLKHGGYYPDGFGFDMNMEAEFYNGGYNTGHYINHEFLTEQQLNTQGVQDLNDGVVRLAPGTYDHYTQWVTFEDSSFVMVSDKGPVYHGIIQIAVSEDGHEAEMVAPMWGFLKTPEGVPIIATGQDIIVSASLEASGELSEQAAKAGYTPGSKSVWGSDTAASFRYSVVPMPTAVADDQLEILPATESVILYQNYPNPFNPQTKIGFYLDQSVPVNLSVFNILGEEVGQLVDSKLIAGHHVYYWNAKNVAGQPLSSGIYFAVLNAGGAKKVTEMLLIR
ncbi:MAG: T9SS C-terminal target domain-containing protein [Calditrichaeota bacterium]|nr:MAG: T9SS C-terminal target domain-containing protein [Calditrichota bacterium]